MTVETPWGGVLEAASELLVEWLPRKPENDDPAWRMELFASRTPHDEEWETAPGLAEISECGGFPEVLGARRFPVDVELLDFEEGEGSHAGARASAGVPDDAAAQVIELVTATIEASEAEPLDRRARLLIGFMAGTFTDDSACEELVRIHVADEPGGAPLDDELHLLVRDIEGETMRLSLWPRYTPGDPEGRLECVDTLLSELLWMNNNNPVTFETVIEAHGLGLDLTDPAAANSEFCEGWEGVDTWTAPDEAGMRRLGDGELAELVAEAEKAAVELAAATVYPSADVPEAEGHLVTWLLRELVDTASDLVAEDGTAPLAYASEHLLPMDGTGGRLMLVGAQDVALVEIDDAF